MQSSREREIRDHLLNYLDDAVTLDQFKDWLISVTWNHRNGAGAAENELTYEIHLALADQSSGITTESELREALSDLVHVVR